MNELLKQLIDHKGYEEMVRMFKEELDTYNEIDLSLTAEEIGKRYLAYKEAGRIIENILTKIDRVANGLNQKDKIVYR